MKRMPLFGLLLIGLGAHAQDDVVFRAMHDEMQRSIAKLQLEALDKPYFVSYRIVDEESKQVAATLGSVLSSSESRTRFLTVNVRVGDYSLDNSNFLSSPAGGTGVALQMIAGTTQLPLDDDYNELRRQIWLATDGAYKKALEDLSGKRAALQNKNRTEDVADFSKAAPVSITDLAPRVAVDLQDAARLVRDCSALFRKVPSIQTSHVQFSADSRLERFLNSDGSTFTRAAPRVSLRITASTQASDGMLLGDFVAVYGHSMKDLPSEPSLLSQIGEMEDGLRKLQTAPVEDRYIGPVLFEGQAAAVVFARHFAEQLPVQPRLVSNNDQLVEALQLQQSSGLLNRMGARVFPDFLDVVDDPTATHEKESLLFGGYKVDEEGVPSRPTLVVDHGKLKTVLTSRAPVRGVPQSTGNLRERGVAPSNMFVNSAKTSTPEELRKQLLEAAKSRGNRYGIIVRRLSGKSATLAYRVYDDGREELIRNADISGLTAASFKDILAVSEQRVVYTEATPQRNSSPFNFIASSGGQPLETYVVPSLLFDDVTMEKPAGEIPKLPVTGSPLLEKQ
jgi:predicted Zn-dependent protease